ncbi:MAG: hypothetical protein BGO41_07965 [Clostridiales bacterium 38-18]|nr:MAG: hypothetical protein BGO41_07965 [Clostridiales bacterium 38-18]
MKRSIKRKIQNSMFLTNILTLLMTTFILIPIIHAAYGPVTSYMTSSIASDFVKSYEVAVSQSAMKGTGEKNFMESTSIEQVIDNLNQMIENESQLPSEMTIRTEMMESLSIVADGEDDLKRIFVLSKEIYDGANDLPFNYNIFQMDVVASNYSLYIPLNRDDLMGVSETSSLASENRINIVDADGNDIGYLTIRMNPSFYYFLNFIFITLIVLLSLFSIAFVKIMSSFLSRGIMRPVHQTNKQLERMANDDVEALTGYALKIKKPPVEIEEMIRHSNTILSKFKEFRELLENQNEELHMQNDELIHNRELIEHQQSQLIQSEKMASVGQISAAIVHEINTPIGAIKSNAQMMDMVLSQIEAIDEVEAVKKKIAQLKPTNLMIVDASDRVIQIIKSIKNFSRIDQSAFKEADLHEAIDSVLILTSNLWKSRISIIKRYGEIPLIHCYIGLINQVIMNLLVNAIDAIEGTGTIEIETGKANDHVFLRVTDNGVGMSDEINKRIFEQGFTTKPIGKGSGLGLALTKDIVDKHNGHIDVTSEVGKGSCFTVYLPIEPLIKNK